ncbi:hypothetical protein R6Q57_015912 [Mikania cordata]
MENEVIEFDIGLGVGGDETVAIIDDDEDDEMSDDSPTAGINVGSISGSDERDKKIEQLNNELCCARRKCEFYRTNLLSVLKDIEDHKQQLSLKVQITRYSMKDCL